MIFNTENLLLLARALSYTWVALTAFSVSQLYRDGYNIAKQESRIINSLIRLIYWIAVVFTYYAASSFTQIFNVKAHEIFASFSPFIVIPLGILLTKFRKDSIKRQDKEDGV